jgi:hypothetical protein
MPAKHMVSYQPHHQIGYCGAHLARRFFCPAFDILLQLLSAFFRETLASGGDVLLKITVQELTVIEAA